MHRQAGARQQVRQFDHAQAGEELLDHVGFGPGQSLGAEQPAQRSAVRTGIETGQVVGG